MSLLASSLGLKPRRRYRPVLLQCVPLTDSDGAGNLIGRDTIKVLEGLMLEGQLQTLTGLSDDAERRAMNFDFIDFSEDALLLAADLKARSAETKLRVLKLVRPSAEFCCRPSPKAEAWHEMLAQQVLLCIWAWHSTAVGILAGACTDTGPPCYNP